jgi:DNA-binding transcriptional regulator WhiA
MSRWIENGKITDGDFAYLCGNLVTGLFIGHYIRQVGKYKTSKRQLGLTTSDNSYANYVGNVIKRLTNLNPTVGKYTYKTKIKDREYENPRTTMAVSIPIKEIDIFAKLMTLKENFQKMNELMLSSSEEIQKRFLQAILDAKASPIYDRHLKIVLGINEKQLPIISSVLNAYGIHNKAYPKDKPTHIFIRKKKDVEKIINEIDINSKRVKSKIRDLTGNLYNLS